MKSQTKTIGNWKELVEFAENVNPFTHTMYMSGFVNKVNRDGTVKIQKLIFTTKPIQFFYDKPKK